MQIEGGIVILEEHGSVRILEGEGGDILLYRTFIDKSNKISNSLKSGQFKIHVALPRGIMGVLFWMSSCVCKVNKVSLTGTMETNTRGYTNNLPQESVAKAQRNRNQLQT